MQHPRHNGPPDLLPLWIAIAVLFAMIVGVLSGILVAAGGGQSDGAVIKGGAAFGGTLTLALLMINILKR